MPETNTQKILRILLKPAAALEAALHQALNGLTIDTAVGIHLTRIGKKVGAPRGTPDDEVFRREARATISTNKSDGVVNDIIKVARGVVPEAVTILVQPVGVAASILRVEGIVLPTSAVRPLTTLVQRATSAGVRRLVGYSLDPPETVARWSTPGRVWGTSVWSHITDKKES